MLYFVTTHKSIYFWTIYTEYNRAPVANDIYKEIKEDETLQLHINELGSDPGIHYSTFVFIYKLFLE